LLFENYGQEVGGPIYCWSSSLKVGGPVSPGPYGCCAYELKTMRKDQSWQGSGSRQHWSSVLLRSCSWYRVTGPTVNRPKSCSWSWLLSSKYWSWSSSSGKGLGPVSFKIQTQNKLVISENIIINDILPQTKILWVRVYCSQRVYTLTTLTKLSCEATEFGQITRNNGHHLQGHSRSPLSISIESPYATFCL